MLAGLIKNAKPLIEIIKPNPLDLGLIASELQKVYLPDLLRDQLCRELAKQLNVSREHLRGLKPQPSAAQQPTYAENLEPWPDPVDGRSLLHEVSALLNLVIVMDQDSLVAVTLWILLTYLSDTDAIDTLALLVALFAHQAMRQDPPTHCPLQAGAASALLRAPQRGGHLPRNREVRPDHPCG